MNLFPAIPDLFVVEEHPEGGFYVYPTTNPPKPGEVAPKITITSRKDALRYASRMNYAVDEHVKAVFKDALGALANDIVVYGSIPGSAESKEAHSWLMALGHALLDQSVAVVACVHFQQRLRKAYERGKGAARIDLLLQRLGLDSGGVEPSLN